MGFLDILTIVFIILKLINVITWSWWLVLLPGIIELGPCGDSMLCCPTCKHGVVPIPTYHGNKYYPRCPFCGQLLEGENEDER